MKLTARKGRKTRFDRNFELCNVIFLGIVSIVTLFPLYYVLAVSFTDPMEYIVKNGLVLFPEKFSLASYQYILATQSFQRSLLTSIFLATVGTVLSLSVSAALAYGISKKRLPGRKAIVAVIMVTILFHPGIIPNYLLVQNMGLIDNIAALILPVLVNGWNTILMRNFFSNLPVELEESAMLEGANDIQIFIRVALPLSMATLATFGLFYAVSYWNQFFNALLYINQPEKWPLQVLLRNILISSAASGTDAAASDSSITPPTETIKMAVVVLSTIPILIVYPFLQKHFAKGVMVGSVKG